MNNVLGFITANKETIIVALLVFAYCFKELVHYMAQRNPLIDNWDKLEPYSDQAFKLVHSGVEYWGGAVGASSIEKADEYAKTLENFEKAWNVDKLKAVKNLIGWYLSMKNKVEKISANPSHKLTKDTVAVK